MSIIDWNKMRGPFRPETGTGTSVPGLGPDAGVPLSGTGTQLPGTGTQVPGGTGTQLPGTGTAVPGTGTAVPGTGTAVPGGTGTQMPGGGRRPGAPGSISDIPLLEEYVINGIRYKVCQAESAKTLAKRSGEARIFVVENGGRRFCLKLYIPNHGPNHAILDKVQSAKGGFLVALRDHGKWTEPSGRNTFDFEVMDYYEHGSLADFCLRGSETRFREVAMRMAFAIRQCHELGIIHRDIKPENFLFTDSKRQEFVIIDFGIAREFKGSDPVKVDAAKSSYFVSPEGAISSNDRNTYVTPATDFYSMGMTLLALWMGTDNFYRKFPANDLAELDRLKRNNNVIGRLRPSLSIKDHTASLMERLLEFSDNSRAGFDEVMRWYKGEELKSGTAAEEANAKSDFRVVFNEDKNQIARSPEELAKMMMADIEYAKQYLYRGIAKSALQGIRPTLALKIDDITQTKYPRLDEQHAGVFAAALLLDPKIPYTGKSGKPCTTIAEIAKDLWDYRTKYAAELKTTGSPLWVYLTVRGDSKLQALPAKIRPIVAASEVHGVYALIKALVPSTGYLPSTGTEIKDLKQLAKHLITREQPSELADSNHTLWTYLRALGPNGAALAGKFPNEIKYHGNYGLYALCLELVPDFPLYDSSFKQELKTENEIARYVHDYYLSHVDELKDAMNPLWSFLRKKGGEWKRIADTYPALLAQKNNSYAWDVYYRLGDEKKPFSIQFLDDKKWHYVYTLDELRGEMCQHGVTDLTVETFTRVHFPTWLLQSKVQSDRDAAPVVESLVKAAGTNAAKRGWFVFYSILPKVSVEGSSNSNAKSYANNTVGLGRLLNGELSESYTYLQNTTAGTMRNMLLSKDAFASSQLRQFMEARKMHDYIRGIERLLDIQANINAHKSAPYDIWVAQWKIVQYLGFTPQWKFKQAGGPFSTIGDIKTRVSQSERNQLISSSQSFRAFLTLFFHENINGQFTFEKLRDYYNFLKNYCPAYPGLKSSASSDSKLTNAIDGRDSAWRSLKRMQGIAYWVCIPILILVICGLLIMAFTDDSGTLKAVFETVGKWVAIGVCIIGVIGGLSEGGIFGAIIGGLLGYWIPFWIFGFLGSIAPFVLAAIIIGAAIWCLSKLGKDTSDPHIPNQKAYDAAVQQADIYRVCQCFGTTGRTLGSSADPSYIFDRSRSRAETLRKQVRTATLYMVGLTVVAIGMWVALAVAQSSGSYRSHTTETTIVHPAASLVAGDYSGIFHEVPTTMEITSAGTGDFTASIVIRYPSGPMRMKLEGTYNSNTGQLLMHKVGDSRITFNGYLTQKDGMLSYDGGYTNTGKGTSHKFSLKQELLQN